jgi:hypothetical protein
VPLLPPPYHSSTNLATLRVTPHDFLLPHPTSTPPTPHPLPSNPLILYPPPPPSHTSSNHQLPIPPPPPYQQPFPMIPTPIHTILIKTQIQLFPRLLCLISEFTIYNNRPGSSLPHSSNASQSPQHKTPTPCPAPCTTTHPAPRPLTFKCYLPTPRPLTPLYAHTLDRLPLYYPGSILPNKHYISPIPPLLRMTTPISTPGTPPTPTNRTPPALHPAPYLTTPAAPIPQPHRSLGTLRH